MVLFCSVPALNTLPIYSFFGFDIPRNQGTSEGETTILRRLSLLGAQKKLRKGNFMRDVKVQSVLTTGRLIF